ncbi:hypothetical protein NLJ89_g2913 [Agrocybe chaxingu]|uniref:Uncharacterized protein n=1 Tax=Agrocybe chaxingu TaxID=84603 RepID=A0A9W8MYP5_9AGAR|nr:hypothetical protein NLJ89_g2913 [Agrocybe chaxingu]
MDSPVPVIFKRNKGKPKPREKETVANLSADDASETAEDPPSTLATKLKKKIQKAKPKSRLSFGGDEEEGDGEVFKVKKSNLSKKMSLGIYPATVPSSLDQATISTNDSPKYDAAYLEELKASTPSARPPPMKVDPYDADMSVDLADVSMQSMEIDTEETMSFIPSQSSIKVAKEKRERLRKTRDSGEEEYISLSLARREDIPQGPHPESRLMREEDELGEGDDEFAEYTSAQERIALGKKSRKLEASHRKEAMKEMIQDAEEEDEETVEWEQEQLRRGGHRTPEPSSSSKAKQVYKAAPIPSATPVPSLAPAISRLSEQLALLTTSHAKNSAALNSLAQERAEVDDREKEMREMVEKAESKRAWFEGFKEWVESVASFLDEKYPLLEKLEEEHASLLKERADMVNKRRREDDEDDLALFIGPLPTVPSTIPNRVDDFGRTISNPDPVQERRERRVARIARRQIRTSQRRRPAGEEEGGYSTDSSLAPADSNAYTEALQSLATKRKEVLSDVKAEEFRDPGKGRWNMWREKYSDSYVGAWGGLGVVSVWEFWDGRDLHSFRWYKGLYEYCRPGEGKVVEERDLGPDGDLVASMISTAVIPVICRAIEGGSLDVYSQKHIRRMIDLSEEIEASVESGNAKFLMILKSVMTVFQNAISATESSIAKYNSAHQSVPGFNPDAIPARKRFVNRRVKLLKNLLRWRKYTGERFGLGMLVGTLVESCIMTVAKGGWEVGGEDVARMPLRTTVQRWLAHRDDLAQTFSAVHEALKMTISGHSHTQGSFGRSLPALSDPRDLLNKPTTELGTIAGSFSTPSLFLSSRYHGPSPTKNMLMKRKTKTLSITPIDGPNGGNTYVNRSPNSWESPSSSYSAPASFCQVFLSANTAVVATPRGDWLALNFGWGVGTAMGVWVSGGISGGHINPAITIALATFRGFPWKKVPIFILAQVLGGLVGAACVYGNYYHAINIVEGGVGVRTLGTAGLFSTYALPYMTNVSAFFDEFLGTAVLTIVVLAMGDRRNMQPPGGLAPLVLFLLVLGIGASLGMQTGYAINPARDLGPRIMTAMVGYGRQVFTFRNHYWIWCPVMGPILGALFGAFVYDAFLYTGDDSVINKPNAQARRRHLRAQSEQRKRMPVTDEIV